MNFKEQYKSTFSEIHASEEFIKRLSEVEKMRGINFACGISRKKKTFMALLAAAVFTATSAMAVNAGAIDELCGSIRLYINGKEVSASDYIVFDYESSKNFGDGKSYTYTIEVDDESSIEVDDESSIMVEMTGDCTGFNADIIRKQIDGVDFEKVEIS